MNRSNKDNLQETNRMQQRSEIEAPRTHYIIQDFSYNNNGNIMFKVGYKLGYILTKLGQLPFVLFTKIAYTSL